MLIRLKKYIVIEVKSIGRSHYDIYNYVDIIKPRNIVVEKLR